MSRFNFATLTILFCGLFIPGCMTHSMPCEGKGNIQVVCGVDNPEDFAFIPNSDFMIISEYGFKHANKPSRLTIMNLTSLELYQAFPTTQTNNLEAQREWGHTSCPVPTPESFSPHGLDLYTLEDGRQQLLVVNHAGKNSVEFFEVVQTSTKPEIQWRGCVSVDKSVVPNSVKKLPDGGFLVTHMGGDLSKIGGIITSAQGLLGMNTGYVLRWRPGSEHLEKVPGTDAPMANGLELTRDGEFMFVNVYFSSEVRKIRVADGLFIAAAKVSHPDNISWGPNNQLLVASQTPSMFQMAQCRQVPGKSCTADFNIVAVDADNMEARVVFESIEKLLPVATVAEFKNDTLYIGTFAGDRIGIVNDLTM